MPVNQYEAKTCWFSGFRSRRTAELLGIHRTLLYKKIRKYNISLIPG
ncbi:MAG: hypothetical protein GQ542_13500 [Desulforhopalus sp.]|nr:hypothetical protein [Desulforhopalus sp.]